MAENSTIAQISGNPAPTAPGTGPIPTRHMRFRAADQPSQQVPVAPPSFPVSQGIGPLLAHANGYNATMIPMSGLNTVLPSYMNICVRTYFTNQQLVNNDKFLKEVSLYHPDAMDLYTSFIFVYHILRVRKECGNISASESTLFSDLQSEYPIASLPVPGTIVDALQSISTTYNPYEWLGNITTALPALQDFTAPNNAYALNNGRYLLWPNFKFLISQLTATAARPRPTDATWPTLHNTRFTSPGALAGNNTVPVAIRTDSIERLWLRSPHGRVPMTLTLRVAQHFHDVVSGSAAAPFLSGFSLDLPHLNVITSTANATLSSYMGIIDDEGVQNRDTRYRRWPSQLTNMVSTACKYISGSRYLSDVPVNGLGAMHHVARFSPSVRFEIRDPAIVQGGAAAAITNATYQAFFAYHQNAMLDIRDPVASALSVQYAMLSQVNVDFSEAVDAENNPLGAIVNPRNGPFWDYPVAEYGPEAAVVNILESHLPNFVRSTPRRDASD